MDESSRTNGPTNLLAINEIKLNEALLGTRETVHIYVRTEFSAFSRAYR